jgi:NitT/TauT family transport system substrate-binding protein
MLWSRRGWGRWCFAAVLGTGPVGVYAQAAAGGARATTTKLVVALHDKSAFGCLPLTIADRLGYFAAEGIALEFKEFDSEAAALAAVHAGAAHLFSGSFTATVAQRAQGPYLVSFVLQGMAPQIAFGVSQRTLKGFRNARELKGRRIGVTALDSASYRVARLVLARASLSEHDVRYIPLPDPEAALAALRSGELDAIAYPDPLMTRLERAGELRTLVDTRTLRGSEDLFGGVLPECCLAAPATLLATNPDLCQATAHGVVHALKWLRTAGLSDINKAVPESYFDHDRALYFAAFERTRDSWAPDGTMPEAGAKNVARVLARLNSKPVLEAAMLSSTFTNQFALKAKEKFRA